MLLLAEDSPDDAFFFERALGKTGLRCNLQHVSDGGAAIEFLREAASGKRPLPEVLFLDLKMPVRSGFEVLQWLQSQDIAHSLRVVVLSGSNQQADRARAQELGASDYLVKPITRETLAATLKTLNSDTIES